MPQLAAKATVQIGDTKITFEGPADFVESQVAKYAQDSTHSQNKKGHASAPAPTGGTNDNMTEKQMVEAKNPKGHSETVAVLAFVLAQNGKEEFTEEDMRKAYIRAGTRPPKVVSQAIRDAKNACDFVEATAARGVYKLSPHGDRTVRFDLPRGEK